MATGFLRSKDELSAFKRGRVPMRIDGGFVLKSKKEVSHLIGLLASKSMTLSEARVVLASIEMRSIRDAAEALRAKSKKGSKLIPDFKDSELKTFTELPITQVRKAKRKLLKNEFELFSDNRGELPIPRRLIRFLAKCEKRSTFLVLMAYIERGLTLRNRIIKSAGTMKASQIVKRTGLSMRAVRIARAELLALEIITPDTTTFQRKLNRDGAYFTINLSWNAKQEREEAHVDNTASTTIKNAPPVTQKSPQNAPPYLSLIHI